MSPDIKIVGAVPSKQTLGLTQRYLVLQMKCEALSSSLTFEVCFLDTQERRRRLHFSSKFRSYDCSNALSAQLPIDLDQCFGATAFTNANTSGIDGWVNLVIIRSHRFL